MLVVSPGAQPPGSRPRTSVQLLVESLRARPHQSRSARSPGLWSRAFRRREHRHRGHDARLGRRRVHRVRRARRRVQHGMAVGVGAHRRRHRRPAGRAPRGAVDQLRDQPDRVGRGDQPSSPWDSPVPPLGGHRAHRAQQGHLHLGVRRPPPGGHPDRRRDVLHRQADPLRHVRDGVPHLARDVPHSLGPAGAVVRREPPRRGDPRHRRGAHPVPGRDPRRSHRRPRGRVVLDGVAVGLRGQHDQLGGLHRPGRP